MREQVEMLRKAGRILQLLKPEMMSGPRCIDVHEGLVLCFPGYRRVVRGIAVELGMYHHQVGPAVAVEITEETASEFFTVLGKRLGAGGVNPFSVFRHVS